MRSLRVVAASVLGSHIRSRRIGTIARLPKTDQPFEEETIPDYNASHFCQVSPGDVVGDGRYSIVSKLGWGRYSTVWLATDLHRVGSRNRHVSVKFNNCDADRESIQQELKLLQRLSEADSTHRGFHIIRKTVDSFELNSGSGTHLCLVYEPLRETLEIYRRRFPNAQLPVPLLKVYAQVLLVGLDFLHTQCGIIHTDLKLDNILVGFEDESVLYDGAKQFQRAASLFKESSDRRIFQSRNDFGPIRSYMSTPFIADLGLAESVEVGAHPIQPDTYRAPEVVLGWGWSSSADIWNLGNLIWTLATGKDLFPSLRTADGKYDAVKHLARIHAILGAPDPALITQRSRSGWRWSPAIENQHGELCEDACSFYSGPFFDSVSGNFLHMNVVPALQSLHSLVGLVDGGDKAVFVDFISKMLTWDPTERLRARDLLDHPWLDGHMG
ncbi:hypothetical protein BST61_g4250 [Cercospora zeina]